MPPGQTLRHLMAFSPATTADPEALTGALAEARERTFSLVASISDCDLERVHSPLMSPLVWDLGHIAAFEDLWLVHRFGGEPLLRPDLARGLRRLRDAARRPRRPALPAAAPTRAAYLAAVRERTLAVAERHGPGRRAPARAGRCATSSSTPRRCSRRWSWRGWTARRRPSAARRRPRPRRARPASSWSTSRPGRARSAPPADRLRLRQRAPAPRGRAARLPHRPHAGHERDVADVRRGRRLRAARVVDRRGLGVEGGVRHHRPADWTATGASGRWTAASRSTPTSPSSTSPGSRPTPSPARTARASRPRRSGRRRRPGTRRRGRAARSRGATSPGRRGARNVDQRAFGTAPAGAYPAAPRPSGCARDARRRVGVDRERASTATRASPPIPTASTPRSSSAATTACCAAARGRRGRASRRRRSATGTYPQRRQIFSGLRIAKDA